MARFSAIPILVLEVSRTKTQPICCYGGENKWDMNIFFIYLFIKCIQNTKKVKKIHKSITKEPSNILIAYKSLPIKYNMYMYIFINDYIP